ncbi:YafY family protein [Rhodococcus sp. HNM0569]|uniref:helix-turn-helix transcriptional regulator n=1 Tax=Rhodococcus sp. HNM0569 TaxID=2716340 RepID=UPI00146B33A0|nr:YafY family protein [Rhodococcus sp. HNM0569]NLU82668.1 YafY family transcriptional regulator [Rhodococcus sp. HNM0569]
MRETSARLLRLLSLLQVRAEWSGRDLAERLDITTRTVRRDVDKLRSLGYPVEATVGVGGGYRLGAGAQMPPLLLEDDEVVAVALGLQSGALAVSGLDDAPARALAKLRQVMPSRLRHRLASLDVEVDRRVQSSSVDAGVLSAVAAVCHAHERLRFDYVTHDGERARREVEPHRVVRSGTRWYLVAWDLDRDDWRSFRVDRLTPKIPTGPRFAPRPLPDGGAAAFVARGVSRVFGQASARVTLHAPLEVVAPRVSDEWCALEGLPDGRCSVVLHGSSLASIARWLSAFDLDFTVEEPAALRDECRILRDHALTVARRYGCA